MTTENPPVARLQLGQLLREFREKAGKTQDAAATALECKKPRISKIETGKSTISAGDIRLLGELYGIDDEVSETARQLAREARKRTRTRVPDWARRFVAMERISESVRNYENELIPGLLQTDDYVRALGKTTVPELEPAEVDRLIAVRSERQSRLYTDDGPVLTAIINETAIRRPVGGSATMTEQLQHLRKLAELPSVTLQVLPFSVGAHVAMGSSFAILGLREPTGAKIIYTEQLANADYLDNLSHLNQYEQVFDHLMATALDPADSIGLIEQTIHEMP